MIKKGNGKRVGSRGERRDRKGTQKKKNRIKKARDRKIENAERKEVSTAVNILF